MSWPGSIAIALLTGVVGMLAAGYVANLAVGWYRVSSFEGGAGYMVVGLALVGGVAGVVVGLVASRTVGSGFVKALGASEGSILALVGVVGLTARALADVPPEIDGKELLLAVEVQWPATNAASPATEPGEAFVRLSRVTSGVARASRLGPLWKDDARLVDGRWIAPGVVNVFTTRGRRALFVQLGDSIVAGFDLPLRARPASSDRAWSDWVPRTRDGFAVRYRVALDGEPVRSETSGPFEIVTLGHEFHQSGRTTSGTVEFTVRHGGKVVAAEHDGARHDRFDEVAALPGGRALLLHAPDAGDGSGTCYLAREEGGEPHVELVGECYGASEAVELTSDAERWHAARRRERTSGRVDRETLGSGGVFLLRDVVLDAGRLMVRPLQAGHGEQVAGIPPLGLSPDRRSFVRFGHAGQEQGRPQLVVTDAVERRNYALPIDPRRMRYKSVDALDPAWVTHHFAWRRDAAGVDRLVERTGFVPIPYRGELSDVSSSVRWYRLEPATAALCDAVLAFLAREFRAEPLPRESDAREHPLRIDGQQITVACRPDDHYVDVQTEYQAPDTRILDTIARRFDAELATGKHDALFGR
ncbi:hypothetical protein J421_6347 (plasmid) [Gemmatirosa kalamazoonensis]|uniref:Uncharacterized protein n=1 Tax=Gemmatirosa kalamazoonensis TaxID=861299 RepID=W0RTU0_9BACT|nr:hypothetical protein [Gemmatirosa kalamazoonensis]AHG93882.1 hypothetical protein J421_6347 [Gemmatirosa kalamazoonensis]